MAIINKIIMVAPFGFFGPADPRREEKKKRKNYPLGLGPFSPFFPQNRKLEDTGGRERCIEFEVSNLSLIGSSQLFLRGI